MNRVSLNCRGALRPAFAARTTTAATRRIISTYLSQYLSPVKAQEPRRIQKAKARDSPSGKLYPSDLYPGGRNVRTPYGVVKVFEWGPEDGEKVLFLHGIGTPSVGYGDLLREFVNKGYRVMTYDYFGRGHSDCPADLVHDEGLYISQLLLVLASSPLSWTGNEAFNLVGYSFGGCLSTAFASYHPHMLRSLTVVCPGGLVRSENQLSMADRVLYSPYLLPDWLAKKWMRWRLEPESDSGNAAPVEIKGSAEEKDEVPSWDDLMRWQIDTNEGFAGSYLSTFQHGPIYDQHEGDWAVLASLLRERRAPAEKAAVIPGLVDGKICVILGSDDPYVDQHAWVSDANTVLGEDGLEVHVVEGGHEIAIAEGRQVAQCAMQSWERRIQHERECEPIQS